MANRHRAVLEVLSARKPKDVRQPDPSIAKFFGCNVFGDEAMQQYMHKNDYLAVKEIVLLNKKLTGALAERVADAMKRWAQDKGATHMAHWFQPLTGKTAEKHDSFFTLSRDGKAIEEFSGTELTQGEPDGSSFPGGGLRSTFEARGYTAWDPSSSAFVLEVGGQGLTLCLPSIFVTYGGFSMDYKLPLLKSCHYLSKAATPVCRMFDDNVTKVFTTLGWEQEYFIIDEVFCSLRPDLLMTGRTLLGHAAPRGQQLEDHYFGSIPERVFAYQRDLEVEAHKLGIPLRTRHNEVAPAQYETAPMFEEVNVAIDHNQLLMDLMERVAKRHKLAVLLHEKPFAGINGSGKHHNFSMCTNTGQNLLSPGNNPDKNLQFLIFLVCIVKAVHKHADILRASLAYAANDHRLGANEAPPAIISIFVGQTLTKVLTNLETLEDLTTTPRGTDASIQDVDLVENIPFLHKDNTDRNRTSPFAFTGNKFEIRMPGSSINCASAMTVMNAILGSQLIEFKKELDALVDAGELHKTAIRRVLQQYVKESKSILFEGDNYSEAWKKEAAERGLPNLSNTPDALEALITHKANQLFQDSGVFSEEELHAHYDVKMDNYFLQTQLESRALTEMILTIVVPSALEYQTSLAANIAALKAAAAPETAYATQKQYLDQISTAISGMRDAVNRMNENGRVASELPSAAERAHAFKNKVKPFFEEIRKHADSLELLIPDKDWPLIKYREMLFIR